MPEEKEEMKVMREKNHFFSFPIEVLIESIYQGGEGIPLERHPQKAGGRPHSRPPKN